MRIFVVSRVALYREGLLALLSRRDRIDVIGVAADAPEAARTLLAAGRRPDIIVLDMSLPESHESARRLRDDFPLVPVLAVAIPNREGDILACAEAGVAGFVTSEASIDELIEALDSVACGEAVCTPRIAGALIRRVAVLAHGRESMDPVSHLTKREREILGLIDAGLSNQQIAHRLHIELATVRNHVHNILGKLGVHRRSEAAALIRLHAAEPVATVRAPGS
jgi:DNA-binding NarL/FixJ family response regulator